MRGVDLTRVGKGSPVVDCGYVKYAGNPTGLCETAENYMRGGRDALGSVVSAVGGKITDIGNAMSAIGQEIQHSTTSAKDDVCMFGPRPFLGESKL